MTYKDYLDAGGTPLYILDHVGRADSRRKVQCPCGLWAYSGAMTDMRAFDLGEEFACDGCITHWERNLIPINDGDDFVTSYEWWAKLSERIQGSPNLKANAIAAEHLEKAIIRVESREKAYIIASDNHPNKMKLIAYRIALESRRI